MRSKTGSPRALRLGSTALGGIAGALILAGTASTAQATPAYGFANLLFTSFGLTGIFTSGGGLDTGVSSATALVQTSDSSGYPGYPAVSNSKSGTVTSGSNVPEAFSGPAINDPGQDVYTQALTSTSGTRGDAIITGALAGGATSSDVSEGRLNFGPASASSTSGTTTTLNVTFSTSATKTVTLAFNASAFLTASIGQIGDIASAQDSASYAIKNTANNQFVSICDASNVCSTSIAPQALNQSVGTVSPGFVDTFSSPSTSYFYTATLDPGTYSLTLLSGTQERITTVPEPASIALLGAGILGLGFIRQRRRQK